MLPMFPREPRTEAEFQQEVQRSTVTLRRFVQTQLANRYPQRPYPPWLLVTACEMLFQEEMQRLVNKYKMQHRAPTYPLAQTSELMRETIEAGLARFDYKCFLGLA